MKILSYKSSLSFLLILSLLMLNVACDDNPASTEKNQQPLLPPTGSMQADFSLFMGGGAQSMAKNQIFTKQHFVTAAATITLVNAAVIVHMALPVVLFSQAINQAMELQNDGKFHWMFSNDLYTSDLAGWIDVGNQQSLWEMYYSQGQNFDNFLFFSGHCNLDATAGGWKFHNPMTPNVLADIVSIDWTNNSENDRTLTFTNVLNGNPNSGDNLTYTVNGSSRLVQYYDASMGTSALVAWDAITTAGYIQFPNYNNGQPAYWDENQNDLP